MAAVWNMFFAWLPPLLQAALGVMVTLVVLVVIFKVVAFILDLIPFA